jgi:hypothetical protein
MFHIDRGDTYIGRGGDNSVPESRKHGANSRAEITFTLEREPHPLFLPPLPSEHCLAPPASKHAGAITNNGVCIMWPGPCGKRHKSGKVLLGPWAEAGAARAGPDPSKEAAGGDGGVGVHRPRMMGEAWIRMSAMPWAAAQTHK